MSRLQPRGAAGAVITAGLGTAAAGVWVMTGLGWGLVASGIAAVLAGLLAIDVDR